MDLFNLLAMNAANSAFNQQLFFADQPNSIVEDSNDQHSITKQTSSNPERVHKRKRLRRHPVWEYFGDVAEKIVGCKLCSFNTVSAFSTNLKMHLKSHHKLEFIQVMEKELDQLVKEGPDTHEEFASKSPPSDLDTSAPRSKRRRKTAQELRDTINRCKQSIERDRSHHRVSTNKNNHFSLCSKPVQPPKMENVFAQGNGFSAIESIIQQQQTPTSPAIPVKDASSIPVQTSINADDNNDQQAPKIDLHSMIELLKSLDQDSQSEKFVAEVRKNLREAALIQLVDQMGSASFILTNAFQDFLYTMDPTFTLSTEIIQQASNSKTTV